MLVHIDTNWENKNLKINQCESLINLMAKTTPLIVIVDACIHFTCANYIRAVSMVILSRDVTGAQSGLWWWSWN